MVHEKRGWGVVLGPFEIINSSKLGIQTENTQSSHLRKPKLFVIKYVS